MEVSAELKLSTPRVEEPADWELEVQLRNESQQPVRLSTATMRGSVAFEVADESGARVPLGPPPIPPHDLAAGLVELEPGGTLALRFRGNELLGSPPPPGRYRVRFAASAPPLDDAWSGTVESAWAEFEAA
jgi:hypothetical protein